MKIMIKAQTLKESEAHGAAALFQVAVSESCLCQVVRNKKNMIVKKQTHWYNIKTQVSEHT